VMAGRAVWKEAVTLDRHARLAFLRGEGRDRMQRLHALCAALARPFADVYSAPDLSYDWYV